MLLLRVPPLFLLLFLLLLTLAIVLPLTQGFHERAIRRRTHTKPNLTALAASLHFRNVEDLMNTFHDGELVLINFGAINCGPCRLQKKELATVRATLQNYQQKNSKEQSPQQPLPTFHFLAIDTNKWPSVSSRFEVGKLPCLVAVQNGQILFRLEGYVKAEEVVAHVRKAVIPPEK